MRIKIVAIIMIFNITALFAQDIDVLKQINGGFELGNIDYWRFIEVKSKPWLSSVEIVDDSYEGDWAAKFIWGIDPAIGDIVFDLNPAILPQSDYIYKAVAKSLSGPCMLRPHCTFFDANNNILLDIADNSWILTDTYTEHIWELPTSPSETSYVVIGFRAMNADGSRWPDEAMTTIIDDVRLIGPSTSLAPRLMTTTLPSNDVVIASIDVTEEPYNAVNDGSVDATSAFQNAINRASTANGAVVFVPAGKYRFDGNLNIPERVILRGEWENPDSVGNVSGTILMPYAGKGSENGTPFIKVQRGAGIKNLSIWYPEQSAASVSSYPWTIHCHPDGPAGAGDNTSVINVTLVNSYNGIKIGPNGNELHYIRNVYGTPLKQGIWLSQTTDIGRIMNVRFSPKYWSESGLANSPSENTILSWLQNNATTGLVMGRSDWEYIYDISLVGYQTGVQIIKYSDHGPNGVIYGLNIEKSNIGIDLIDLNGIGWAISNSTIKVEGENSACVRAHDNFVSVVQFNTCTFGGDPESAIKFSNKSKVRLSFQNCTFENWGQNGDFPAIDCQKGSLSLMGNTFNLDKLHLRLGANVTNAQVLDNTFPNKLKIENNSDGEVLISQEPLGLTKQNVPTHPYAAEPRPANNNFFSVVDFGAVADGSTDNTLAFQTALDSASVNGGGTVYIPAGMFKISSHIIVPTGVELRGIWDVPHHTTSKGSVLLAYEGKGNPDGTSFISLESDAGVRGFTVWYPEQSTNFFAFPWSIRTLGENCWIKDVVLANTYQGVDLASYPSAGHRVSYLGGSPFKTGISVDKSTGDGWIENIQFNPHYWARSIGYPQDTELDFTAVIKYQQANLEAFKIGSATQEHVLGTFVFAADKGMYLAPDDGTSNIDIFQHGTDAGSNAVFLESNAGSKINFVNTQLVLLGDNQNGTITTVPGFDADVSFFNSISWGGQGPTANFKGDGNILLQQFHSINGIFKLKSGAARLDNIAISSTLKPQYVIGSGINKPKIFGSYASNGFEMFKYGADKSSVEADYYFNKNTKDPAFATSWEKGEIKCSWENIFYGNKEFLIDDKVVFHCEAVDTIDAHTGTRALAVAGSEINGEAPYYKIFNFNIDVFNNSVISYWLHPKDEAGRTGHIDLLFTDGTRLSELSPVADDGLPLEKARGNIGEWTEVKCAIGTYAAGKVIQTILVGAKLDTDNKYRFLIDDFNADGSTSAKRLWSDNSEMSLQNYPNPFHSNTTISYNLVKSGFVSVTVYNMLGEKISVLEENQHKSTGSYEVKWTPGNLEGGMYFYKLKFLSDTRNKTVISNKMILTK